jgi:hypothetical protein
VYQKDSVSFSGVFVPAMVWPVSANRDVTPARMPREQRKSSSQKINLTFGMMYVAPSYTYVPISQASGSQPSDEVLDKFKASLRDSKSDVLSMTPDENMSAIIPDTKVLLLDDSKHHPRVQAFRKKGAEPDVLFGIIDTKGRMRLETSTPTLSSSATGKLVVSPTA